MSQSTETIPVSGAVDWWLSSIPPWVMDKGIEDARFLVPSWENDKDKDAFAAQNVRIIASVISWGKEGDHRYIGPSQWKKKSLSLVKSYEYALRC